MPAKKHVLEEEQFYKNKRRQINTTDSTGQSSISYYEIKDSPDDSVVIDYSLDNLTWEEEFSLASTDEEEEYSLADLSEEEESSIARSNEGNSAVTLYIPLFQTSYGVEVKALLSEILTGDNIQTLEMFLLHYPTIIFEDFSFTSGDSMAKLDVLNYAVKQKCHPQMIKTLFNFLDDSSAKLDQFNFYALINSMTLIYPELDSMKNKMLSLVIELERGEITNKLFIIAMEAIIDQLDDSINQVEPARNQLSPLLQNTFLKNTSYHRHHIKNSSANEALSELLWTLKLEGLLEEKNRLVEWIADEDNHNAALINSIQICIKYFRAFLEDPLLDTKYKAYTNDLMAGCERLTSASRMLPLSVTPSDNNHITYLIPYAEDLMAMSSLCAGAEESQMQRLGYLSHILKKELGEAPLCKTRTSVTQHAVDRLPWQLVFKAIKLNDVTLVKAAFAHIPKEDLLLKALLEVYSYKYLLDLAVQCAELKINEDKVIYADVVCSHLTFEVLITDLISTLEQRRDINFSFGLPTHHAYREHPAGFCIINKVAVLFAYEQSITDNLFEAFIIGFDVNRDDGLNKTSMNLPATHSLTHIDIHDSRVYPWHDASTIDEILGMDHHRQDKMNVWEKENKLYKTIDLAENLREGSARHPALVTALKELESSLKNAQKSGRKIIIFLPTGWDSHCEEQAHCGRKISKKRFLDQKESKQCRFTDEDINYFNHELNQLYTLRE